MAAFLVVACLVLMYISECSGAICSSVRDRRPYMSPYVYCSSGCCGTMYRRTCCTSNGTIAGIIIGVILCVCFLGFVASLCLKKKNRPGRVVMPHADAHTNVTVVYAGMSDGNTGFRPPLGYVPVPPPYTVQDAPPPYTDIVTGQDAGRKIYTASLPPGNIYPPPTSPPPAWQPPEPGLSLFLNNMSVLQPEPQVPSNDIPSWQVPPYTQQRQSRTAYSEVPLPGEILVFPGSPNANLS